MSFKDLTAEAERLGASLKATKRDLVRQSKTLNDVISHCDGELARLKSEPNAARREFYTELYMVRRGLASNNLEIARMVLQFDPENVATLKAFQANIPMIENLRRIVRYQALEFSVLNYRPIAKEVENALRGAGSGAPGAPAAGGTTGRLQRAATTPPRAGGTGPLSGGSGPLSAARGPAPGAGTSGRLSAAKPGGTGRLSGGDAPAPAGGTGRLSGAPAPATGTGRLSAPAAQGQTGRLVDRLTKIVGEAGKRQQLELLTASYQEVAEAMAGLRGASIGEPGIPTEALEPQLNKIAGKIYYLDRLVSQLGPEAAFLAFESESTDTELERFLASQALGAANSGEGGAVGEKSLTSKLRGFFNI